MCRNKVEVGVPLLVVATSLLLSACATNLGIGSQTVKHLETSYPITVGRLIEAHMDTGSRLRIYLQLCQDLGLGGMACSEDDLRILAVVAAEKKSLLRRLAELYLDEGREKPVYVYGPMCEGLEEMILVPRCQQAVALGVWDPYLHDYVLYSTEHGSGSLIESEGFHTFLELTGKAVGIVKKAAK
jgi:predicted small secreted protein